MVAAIRNTFATGLAPGTGVTTANSGGVAGKAFDSQSLTSATCTYVASAPPNHGGLAIQLAIASGGNGYNNWNYTPTAVTTRVAFDILIRIDITGVAVSLMKFQAAGWGITYNGSKIVIFDASGTIYTSTFSPVAGVWYRFEEALTVGTTTANGSWNHRVYVLDEPNLNNFVDAFNTGTANLGTTTQTNWIIGDNSTTAAATSVSYADAKLAELGSGFIGPLSFQNGTAPRGARRRGPRFLTFEQSPRDTTYAGTPGTPAFSDVATYSETGTFAATGSPAFAVGVGFGQTGTFTATGVPSFPGVGTYSETGTLSIVAGPPAVAGTATYSETGTLSEIASTPTVAGSAAYSETGTLTETGGASFVGSATYSEAGTFAATAVPAIASIATYSETGTFSAIGLIATATIATYGETGTFTASTSSAPSATATYSETGTYTATANAPTMAGAAAYFETGTLTVAGVPAAGTTTGYSETGTLSITAGPPKVVAAATYSEVGTLAAVARAMLIMAAVYSEIGTFSASGVSFAPRDLQLTVVPLPPRFGTLPIPDRFTVGQFRNRFDVWPLQVRFTTSPLPVRFTLIPEDTR